MDWVKVAKALDNEWYRRKQLVELGHTRGEDTGVQKLLSSMAFMLRDCLVMGMSTSELKRFNDLTNN
jgi:hypothetical protein